MLPAWQRHHAGTHNTLQHEDNTSTQLQGEATVELGTATSNSVPRTTCTRLGLQQLPAKQIGMHFRKALIKVQWLLQTAPRPGPGTQKAAALHSHRRELLEIFPPLLTRTMVVCMGANASSYALLAASRSVTPLPAAAACSPAAAGGLTPLIRRSKSSWMKRMADVSRCRLRVVLFLTCH